MIELEDFFEDVIGKTIRGTGIADGVLSFLTNVEPDAIAKLKNGEFDELAVRAIAPALGLDANCLVELANRYGGRSRLSSRDFGSLILSLIQTRKT